MKYSIGFVLVFCIASPTMSQSPTKSPLGIGDEISAWEPIHIAGPHRGTKTCPVCTYLDAPMAIAFAKDVAEAKRLVKSMEEIAKIHSKGKLKLVLVVIDGSDDEIEKLAKTFDVRFLMVCKPDPERKEKQLNLYKVDNNITNVIYICQDYKVRGNWTSLTDEQIQAMKKSLDLFLPKR
jgi:hypothetical protein